MSSSGPSVGNSLILLLFLQRDTRFAVHFAQFATVA